MPIYSRFDPTKSGGVNAQAHPNVYSYPWITTQKRVRANPNPAEDVGSIANQGQVVDTMQSGTRNQRIQPNEKKPFFTKRGYSMAADSPDRKASCPCGGKCSTEGSSNKSEGV